MRRHGRDLSWFSGHARACKAWMRISFMLLLCSDLPASEDKQRYENDKQIETLCLKSGTHLSMN